MRAPRLALPALALALGLPSCGAFFTSIDEVPCPEGGTALTYANFGADFMSRHCQYCHGSAVADRAGAPGEFIFDTVEQVQRHKDRIFARAAADNDSMPPGPDDPPQAERDELAEWLACGAPP